MCGGGKEARAIQASADQQAEATRKAAEAASKSAREAAVQAQTQMEQNAARNAAVGAANDAINKPMEEADVQLETPSAGVSVAGTARKRRQTFGLGSSGTGVNI